jgi:hypothetical protein
MLPMVWDWQWRVRVRFRAALDVAMRTALNIVGNSLEPTVELLPADR